MKKGQTFLFRLDYTDEYKLDFCINKTGLDKSNLIRLLIDGLFHDLNPPFREYSS